MERQTFKVLIDAPCEKVWNTLWDDASYRIWTAPFSEGSHAVTDWKKGSKVLFLDGKNRGMVSKIAENKPHEFMSFQHLGEVKDGVEDYDSDAVKTWAGGYENYTLKPENGKTVLLVEMDMNDDFKDYFMKTWPKAIEALKLLAEKR